MLRNMRVGQILVLLVLIGLAMAAPARSAKSTPPKPVSIVITDYLDSDTSAVGTFTMSGAIETSGFESQVFRMAGITLHCEHTLVDTVGTIIIHSDCNFITLEVQWRVVSGTGAYSGLKANGGGFMEFTNDPTEGIEHWTGIVY